MFIFIDWKPIKILFDNIWSLLHDELKKFYNFKYEINETSIWSNISEVVKY